MREVLPNDAKSDVYADLQKATHKYVNSTKKYAMPWRRRSEERKEINEKMEIEEKKEKKEKKKKKKKKMERERK